MDVDEHSGIYLGLIWDRILALSRFGNKQKLPKMVYIIPILLVIHFFRKFHENLNKNSKVTDV